jgi:hypothetical protein
VSSHSIPHHSQTTTRALFDFEREAIHGRERFTGSRDMSRTAMVSLEDASTPERRHIAKGRPRVLAAQRRGRLCLCWHHSALSRRITPPEPPRCPRNVAFASPVVNRAYVIASYSLAIAVLDQVTLCPAGPHQPPRMASVR